MSYPPSPILREINALLEQTSEDEQLTILSNILNGVHCHANDAFCDALAPVEQAFEDAYGDLAFAAEPEGSGLGARWSGADQERLQGSFR